MPTLDPVRSQRICDVEREGPGDDRLGDTQLAAGPGDDLVADLVLVAPASHQLVEAVVLAGMHLETRQRAEPRELQRVRDHVPRAVPLEVEEGIRDGERDLVPELGRANGIGVDQDVRHGREDPIPG